MKNEKIELYIRSVIQVLPKKMRKYVKNELQNMIFEMLKKRCGENDPDECDIRVVLAELDEPVKMAEKYSPYPLALISGTYYVGYLITVKIVLISVVFGISLASLIEYFTNNGIVWYMCILYWIGRLIPGLFLSFGIVTLVFAILEKLKYIKQKDN